MKLVLSLKYLSYIKNNIDFFLDEIWEGIKK